MKLAFKMVSAFILVVILVTAIHGYFEVRREMLQFELDAKDDAETLGDALEEVVAAAWRRAGDAGVSELIRSATAEDHNMLIRWVHFDARPGDPYCPMAPSHRLTPLVIEQNLTIRVQHADGTPHLHAYWPVSAAGMHGAGLEFSRAMTRLEHEKWALIYRTALLIGSIVGLTSLFAAGLGVRFIARPLERLMDKTRRIGAGDLSAPVHLKTRDELEELARGLNRMCDQLADSQARVREETSSRIAAMEQLRHADRLKTVGRLASGMAHELGTPLNVVSGRAGLIASGKLSAQEITDSAAAIKREAERMATIIRQLLDFARSRSPQRKSVDLRHVARQTVDLLGALAEKQGVKLRTMDLNQPAPANVDVAQIQQVLINVVMNAIQAVPRGGKVELDLRPQQARPPGGREGTEGAYYRIDVRDEGEGISEADLQQVFAPFFTTREVGEGTGLGLSIAYGIVEEHGGWIDVSSELAKGSCFSVYLPREAAP